MKNPFNQKVRGVFYILGLFVGGIATVIGPLSLALSWSPDWLAVATSTTGALTVFLSSLAKENLPSLETAETASVIVKPQEDSPEFLVAEEVVAE